MRQKGERFQPNSRKRIKFVLGILLIFLLILVGRLLYLQVGCHEKYQEDAESQYRLELVGIDTRGQIFDRNGVPLTGTAYDYYYLIKFDDLAKKPKGYEVLSELNCENITKKSKTYAVFRTSDYDSRLCRQLERDLDAYVFRIPKRYSSKQPAQNIIGKVDESSEKGISGLELVFDKQLRGIQGRITLVADGTGNIIKGFGPFIEKKMDNEVYPAFSSGWESLKEFYKEEEDETEKLQSIYGKDITTSLDAELQTECENILKSVCLQPDTSGNNSGPNEAACIITDVETGEVVSLATISNDSDKNPGFEKSYSPGNMMKLFILATAIQEDKWDGDYLCTCNGDNGQCSKKHGEVNLRKAVEDDCCEYFAQLAMDLGYNSILENLYNLGFGQEVLNIFDSESKGYLPYTEDVDSGILRSIACGNGPIRVTAIQVAKAATIIGRQGSDCDLTIIKAGTEERDADKDKDVQILSQKTVERLIDMDIPSRDYAFSSYLKMMGVDYERSFKSNEQKIENTNYWHIGRCRSELGTGSRENRTEEMKRYVITTFVRGDTKCQGLSGKVFFEVCRYLNGYKN